MENWDERIVVLIRDGISNQLFKLNNLIYEFEWAFIFGIILVFFSIRMVGDYEKIYRYRYQISKYMKKCIIIIASGWFIKALKIESVGAIFDYIYYNLIPVIIITISGGWIFEYLLWKNKDEKLFLRYINYFISFTYFILMISALYEIKDLILPILTLLNLESLKYIVRNKSTNRIDKRRVKLYSTRNDQLKILMDIIEASDYENYAIGLDGEWGKGKTVLIEELLYEIKNKDNYCIHIKPLVSDTRESLIKDFQKKLSKIMIENGIYSGKSSSTQMYFKEILKLVEFNKKISLADFVDIFKTEDIQKNLKESLQDDIDSLLESDGVNTGKKLIVIVDDFDRIDEEQQLVILNFIKEVVDFKGCVTIVALDYDNVKGNEVVNPLYLEKFIATTQVVTPLKFEELIEFHFDDILSKIKIKEGFVNDIVKEIKKNKITYYHGILSRLERDYKKKNEKDTKDESDKQYAEEFKQHYEKKLQNINNSRRVIHFLNEIKDTIALIEKNCMNIEKLKKFLVLKKIQVSEIIYIFNFIKVFDKELYQKIIKSKGVREYYEFEKNKDENKTEIEYFKSIFERTSILEKVYVVSQKR